PTPAISTLSLHDALPICDAPAPPARRFAPVGSSDPRRQVAELGSGFQLLRERLPELLHLRVRDHADIGLVRIPLRVVVVILLGRDRKSTRLNSSHVKISY